MSSWIGLVAPAGTPPAIVKRIQQDVVKAMADPTVADRLEKPASVSATTTPERNSRNYFRSEAELLDKGL